MRNRHKPEYLEGRLPRETLKLFELEPARSKRHYADIFFRAWAVFWGEEFLDRMIQKIDSRIIASVPLELITEKNAFRAVSNSGLALRYVPHSLRSLAVCAQAVKNDAAAIAFTPGHLRVQIRNLQASGFE